MPETINTRLNLPAFSCKMIDGVNGKQIFDEIRRKFVPLTSEEWVRQHFIHYLIAYRGVPAGLIQVEVALIINGVNHRADIVVNDKKAEPLMVVECKSTDVNLTNNVVNQVCRYNIKYNAPYVLVTNGLRHVCVKINRADGSFKIVQIPSYDEMNS